MDKPSRNRFLFLATLLLGGTAAFAAGSCDSADAAFDCQSVCQRYHDCYDASYDVGACRDRCRTRSANDTSVRQAADACEACIGDRSCLSATFACGADCGSVVP